MVLDLRFILYDYLQSRHKQAYLEIDFPMQEIANAVAIVVLDLKLMKLGDCCLPLYTQAIET